MVEKVDIPEIVRKELVKENRKMVTEKLSKLFDWFAEFMRKEAREWPHNEEELAEELLSDIILHVKENGLERKLRSDDKKEFVSGLKEVIQFSFNSGVIASLHYLMALRYYIILKVFRREFLKRIPKATYYRWLKRFEWVLSPESFKSLYLIRNEVMLFMNIAVVLEWIAELKNCLKELELPDDIVSVIEKFTMAHHYRA